MSDLLGELREELDEVNRQLLQLISRRGAIAQEIGRHKETQGVPKFDPVREKQMLEQLIAENRGPFDDATIGKLFKELFKASLTLQQHGHKRQLLASRAKQAADTVIRVKDVEIGGSRSTLVAGPCSVESREQMTLAAQALKRAGVRVIRGGAYKPRTSPYDFQGLGLEGLKLLKEIGDQFDLVTVSEIVNPVDVEMASDYVDIIQIGARNMQNFELLKAAGDCRTPILLKRGIAATLEEFVHAAEYVLSRGNMQVMLIERGIRTYEKWTRNTLDISAVPILKKETHLPVLVDVSHSTGRKDIVIPCAKAALAAGADGVMIEVHPEPVMARSDAEQQLDIPQFLDFVDQLQASGLYRNR